MLNLAAVRTTLGNWLDDHKETVEKVYRRAIGGAFTWPAVVLGQPTLEEADVQPCGVHRWTFPVHVVVGRPGQDEEATQQLLEGCWTEVYGQLDQMLAEDPYLGAADVQEAHLERADFGSLLVAGQAYPAYEITLSVLG